MSLCEEKMIEMKMTNSFVKEEKERTKVTIIVRILLLLLKVMKSEMKMSMM